MVNLVKAVDTHFNFSSHRAVRYFNLIQKAKSINAVNTIMYEAAKDYNLILSDYDKLFDLSLLKAKTICTAE